MKVVLGVAGGIAAYKACSLLRLLTEAGHDVTVVPTASALHFVGEATWSALSGKQVHTDVWSDITEVPHVRIGQEADLVVVAPATADLLARAATGQADDLLTNVLLTAHCPVVLAPAMHTEMWEHAATQANVATLTERGVHVVPPASGRLTGTDSGPGRMPEPHELFAVCERELTAAEGDRPLAGRRVVVTAGGTREPLDPVRYLGNRSSGKQGYAVARVAAQRGADVVLVTSAELPVPQGVRAVPVETALEMARAVEQEAVGADVVVMAAAVADFRPAQVAGHKIKKTHEAGPDGAPDESAPTVALVRNPDILAGLVAGRGEALAPVVVGFAAETGDEAASVLEHGRAKLARKGCDLLVVNEVGAGLTFGADESTVHILRRGSEDVLDVGPASKDVVAGALWDAVAELL
ncbi:bifunctional phosphopantothenoylcysteine decarboxylase/phosphopantothenate--cysteine ligase CoaBC [Phycicoccus endophyticus]|uniref:Coenzyme A biosynthesis bifunctional protein CoaBC n=1 Tax=Phycicoccus endophyticus TaxID=1690220 RepID=A0A7G9R491_9MICO|nr:bifunctional phosphopantothenoylcysteine decarboxylase/phosphopantothenate--cysteine ligase CoaBC [Phycicoccus endophyticus]NHI18275.1 bifunctional phosphopantothenoylcysteine decarboxylase/phosphopantothenate--cysteine ligase CoaBC [Phycicoccus endophyticus]QNN50416.1 bifunctional phosphopantothenoylcysteine decarboxylase/phosphopantothenate--cysteine ligase CoaBC [Phycicoccus endophyticus]GGL25050.1 phosphopantothenoylcysteine decarboxylase [Phycicoccus endophyticus]